MSEEDVPAGARWTRDVAAHLETAAFGIICLTPENRAEPWILFEAGALAKTIDHAFVCPYLIGIEPSEISGPLAQFQAKRTKKAETFDLLRSINARLLSHNPSAALGETEIATTFERWWPDLEAKLGNLPEAAPQHTVERKEREILEEVLELTRQTARQFAEKPLTPDIVAAGLAMKPLRQYIRSKRAALAGFMEQGAGLALVGNVLFVTPRNEIYIRYLNDNRSAISQLATEFFGEKIRVHINVDESIPTS